MIPSDSTIILVTEELTAFLTVCNFVGTASVAEVLWPLATYGHKNISGQTLYMVQEGVPWDRDSC